MPRFFTSDISGNKAHITGGDALHIAKSLRMRNGESLEICDLNGSDYRCLLSHVTETLVVADILEKLPCKSEPAVKLSLYQALPKSDKLELIAQKAVELGVTEITPVITSRCVSRWNPGDEEKKRGRLQKIMLEAAKQSGRGIIPQILPLAGYESAIKSMKSSGLAILFYEKATTPLREILSARVESISIMAGSEGGFSEEEALYATENGVSAASLGPRILRCETASLCALSAILYSHGEI